MILSIFWFKNYYIFSEIKETVKGENTFLFWNVDKQKDFNVKILKEITGHQNIETIILVEAYHKTSNFKTEFQNQLIDYNIMYLQSDMIIASKKNIKSINYLYYKQNLKLNHIKIGIEDKAKTFAVIDVYASPLHKKEDALSKIINYANQNDVDVILGDFNTPYESIYFEKFKNDYLSFRAYQNGFTATWPYGIPLLELDQIWLNDKIKPIKLDKTYFHNSDHAVLIGKFASDF
ncbi:endonuclease/exonuclease/phosphatase family protein [Winogradskyella sp. R77965]|uniref:endonuclease/exonuclease/phosphatase family protein n=1 Tax=Winogradskyella sp. R77965 TaxID=3093872 RepID=UPI0037DDB0A6